jgi:hypothetical protein
MASEGKTPKRPKASVVLTERRVGEMLRIRLDGAERWDIVDYIRSKECEAGSAWELKAGASPLSEAMIWKLLERADALIHESHSRNRKQLFRRHLAQRRNLYAKAVLAGDLRTALACVKDEAEMLGLYPAKKVKNEHTGKGDSPLIPPELVPDAATRAAALARLRAAVGAGDGVPPGDGPAPAV